MAPVKKAKAEKARAFTKSSTKSKSKKAHEKVTTKPAHATSNNQKKKKKRRTYTDAELGIPKLNAITPAGIQKPKGKKKGKVFVDDSASMLTILAMVHAEKEGNIESKMARARQMEEVREARRKEAEARQEEKRGKLVRPIVDLIDSMYARSC